VVYPPDGHSYQLEFSETVTAVADNLTWTGTGTLGAVTKTGAYRYKVEFSGMTPGTTSTLTVGTGVVDHCGNPLSSAVDVDITLLARCHLLSEDFEGDFFSAGWTAVDNAADGNLWARSDELDAPTGVPNHTIGSGLCASVGDHGNGAGSVWNAELRAPVMDLSGATNVVVSYQGAFQNAQGDEVARLEASANGTSWTTLSSWTADHGPGLDTADLSGYAGGNVYLRWRYSDPDGLGYWWDVDDVCVEEYTMQPCPCPGGAHTETLDIAGQVLGDGNGTLGKAEPTGVTLAALDDKVAMCGQLEDTSTSGPDYFVFHAAGGPATDQYELRVSYCIENNFQPAAIDLWTKTEGQPIAGASAATAQGDFTVTVGGGSDYYLSISAGTLPYRKSQYSMSVNVEGKLGAILTEGFEEWPPTSLTMTDDDACLSWSQHTQTLELPNALPTEGTYMAMFNSYDCPTGSESLQSASLNLHALGLATLTLYFDMYHDTGYPDALDNIQVQYKVGALWTNIGPQFNRPAAVEGWTTESVDMSSIKSQSAVQIRLMATTAYGNNFYIDNVILLGS